MALVGDLSPSSKSVVPVDCPFVFCLNVDLFGVASALYVLQYALR